MKLLQWNVWFRESYGNILEVLRQNPAEVYCLQELTIGFEGQGNIDMPAKLAYDLDMNVVHSEMKIHGGEYILCNAILSSYPISSSYTADINISTGTDDFDDEHRTVLFADVETGDQTFTIATTHMSYTKAFKETKRKTQETMKLIDAVQRYDKNFILAGDLNALPDSQTIEALKKQLKNLGPDFAENTWTTKPFRYQNFDAHTLDWRLDYVFGTHDIEQKDARIIETRVSDHLPIIIEV